eukprot:SAG31_NODE_19906_length_588_cov_1.789366_1_plen_88_part_10
MGVRRSLVSTAFHEQSIASPHVKIDWYIFTCSIWEDKTNTLSGQRWHIFAHTDFSGLAEESHWAHVAAHAVASSPYGPWKVVCFDMHT